MRNLITTFRTVYTVLALVSRPPCYSPADVLPVLINYTDDEVVKSRFQFG